MRTVICLQGGTTKKVTPTKKESNNTRKPTQVKPVNNRKTLFPIKVNTKVKNYLMKAEKVNGRAAMIGFTSAVIEEIVNGKSLNTQFMENIGITCSVIGLVLYGTAFNPKNDGESKIKSFNEKSESVNGRLAMIGIVALLLSESLNVTTPLF